MLLHRRHLADALPFIKQSNKRLAPPEPVSAAEPQPTATAQPAPPEPTVPVPASQPVTSAARFQLQQCCDAPRLSYVRNNAVLKLAEVLGDE